MKDVRLKAGSEMRERERERGGRKEREKIN